MKKKKWSTILLLVIFLVGLGVLSYPTISNYINQFSATHAIASYDKVLNTMTKEEYHAILESAQSYNRTSEIGKFLNGEPVDANYLSQLNVTGDGMMGYVEIKKLGVSLPIYHGTSERILQHSAGHLEGSSLPIGGEGTHAVITGHRGLPTAKLFTDLDRLELGDTFAIVVMNEVLTYEVDQIKIVEPEDVSKLAIIPGEDHVTLVTCTPYAVNTHRLLVRGVRTAGASVLRVSADAVQVDPMLVAPVVAAPMLLALLVWLLFSSGKRRTAKKNDQNNQKGGG